MRDGEQARGDNDARQQPDDLRGRSPDGAAMSRRIGIALSSGGARGWAHIGVLRVLEEAGHAPAVVCGSSVGAVIGGLYVVGRLNAFVQFSRRINRIRLSQYFDFKLGAGGIIGGARVLRVLAPEFGNVTFETLPRRFACVATDLGNGEEVWLKSGTVLPALRASYAIPGLFPPVEREGRWLVDGALANPVPVSLCRALGAEVVIAVDVNAGLLVPLKDAALDGAGALAGRGSPSFMRGFFRRRKGAPSTFTVVSRTLQIAQTRLARMRIAEDPPDIVLHPDVGHVGPLEFHRASQCIADGERAMRQALPTLEAALAKARPTRSSG